MSDQYDIEDYLCPRHCPSPAHPTPSLVAFSELCPKCREEQDQPKPVPSLASLSGIAMPTETFRKLYSVKASDPWKIRGEAGEPLRNKTAVVSLQDEVRKLQAAVIHLEERIDDLENQITILETNSGMRGDY